MTFIFQVDLTFARELSFYMVTIYTPCFMIVVVSWFSFWLDYKVTPFFDEPIRSGFSYYTDQSEKRDALICGQSEAAQQLFYSTNQWQ
jgi:hypothetical protein